MLPNATWRTALVCLTITVFTAPVPANQTVYRCGPAGNQYSAHPCADGRPIDVSDRRSAEQLADSRNGVAAQRRLAVAMARDRSAAERANPPAKAGSIGPLPAPAARTQAAMRPEPASGKAKATKTGVAAIRNDDGGDFVAIVPGSHKPTRKKTQP